MGVRVSSHLEESAVGGKASLDTDTDRYALIATGSAEDEDELLLLPLPPAPFDCVDPVERGSRVRLATLGDGGGELALGGGRGDGLSTFRL